MNVGKASSQSSSAKQFVDENNKIRIAKILAPHGLLGACKILAFTGDKRSFTEYACFWLNEKPYSVQYLKPAGKHFLLKLQSIDSIEAIERHRNAYLYTEIKETKAFKSLLPSEKNAGNLVFISQIIGFQAAVSASDIRPLLQRKEDFPSKNYFQSLLKKKADDDYLHTIGDVLAYYPAGADGLIEVELFSSEELTVDTSKHSASRLFFIPCHKEYIKDIQSSEKIVIIGNLSKLIV